MEDSELREALASGLVDAMRVQPQRPDLTVLELARFYADALLPLIREREARLVAEVKPLALECQGLVSRYTRAPGANGDRVADLLSEDTYRIGTAILAALADADGRA